MTSRLHRGFTTLVVLAFLSGCETTEKKRRKPPPPPPPGSELSTQPWARGEKDWELGRPAFLPESH